MSDFEPIDIRAARQSFRRTESGPAGEAGPIKSSNQPPPLMAKAMPANISFDRHELREILNIYGRKVVEGEWRDYAIDFTPNLAVFSIFRRASEMPLYRIVKNPKPARKQGLYSVITTTGLILKRGHDLVNVIAVLEKKLKLVR